jgi:hypothetical protein
MLPLSKSINAKGRYSTPGGSVVYMTEFDNLSGYTATTDASGNTYITALSLKAGKYMYSFSMNRENINFTNKYEVNAPAGVRNFTPTLTFNLPGLDADRLLVFDTLTYVPVLCIVLTKEDKYFLLFRENGGDLSADSTQSLGLATLDAIGSAFSIVGSEKVPMIQLNPSTAVSIMAGIVSA